MTKTPTQHKAILDILSDKGWHCSQDFQRHLIPEYRSRINELRKGKTADKVIHAIIDEPCLNRCGGSHNRVTRRWRLKLDNEPSELSLKVAAILKQYPAKAVNKQLTLI